MQIGRSVYTQTSRDIDRLTGRQTIMTSRHRERHIDPNGKHRNSSIFEQLCHTTRHMDWETDKWTDKQTGSQTDRQAGRLADRRTNREADRQTGLQTWSQTGGQTD